MKKVVLLLVFVFLLALMSFMVSATEYCIWSGKFSNDFDDPGYQSRVEQVTSSTRLQPGERYCKIGVVRCDGGPECKRDMTAIQCVKVGNKCAEVISICSAPELYCEISQLASGFSAGCSYCAARTSFVTVSPSSISQLEEREIISIKPVKNDPTKPSSGVGLYRRTASSTNNKATSVMNPFPEEVGSIATMLVLFGLLVSLIFLFKRD